MLMEEYRVRLDQFSGPLDLLLHLIRRAEVDISEISVAQITDQYLEHVGQAESIDVDLAGEFLVTAATLIEVKSRLLAPEESRPESRFGQLQRREPEDPAGDLVRQLLAYRAFRDAADRLEARRVEWSRRVPLHRLALESGAELPQADDLDLEDLSLYDLMESYRRLAETVVFDRLGAHEVHEDDTPIELHATDVLDRLRRLHVSGGMAPSMPLRSVFADREKGDVIGLFLAVLELIRQRSVVLVGAPDEVRIELVPDDAGSQGSWDDDDILDDGDIDEEDEDDPLP